MSSIKQQTSCAVGSRSPDTPSKLSFSLLAGKDISLLDLDAIHAQQFAEWTDGLRVLRESGAMASPETSDYVHILTELALKVRLLDITGDGIEIPQKAAFGSAPKSTDFWFAS